MASVPLTEAYREVEKKAQAGKLGAGCWVWLAAAAAFHGHLKKTLEL